MGADVMADAELGRFVDRFTVEFVRVFPHPIERVWRALTEPDELAGWFMSATIDLRVGGAYTFEDEPWGLIEALDPPRLVRFGKFMARAGPGAVGENYFQYLLTPEGGGTRVTFTERWPMGVDYRAAFIRRFGADGDDLPGGPDTPFHIGTLSGWHDAFDTLRAHLDGVPFTKRWAELHAIYRAHVKATLPREGY